MDDLTPRDLQAVADLLAGPPPGDDVMARGRDQLTRLVRAESGDTESGDQAPAAPVPLRHRFSRRVLAGAVAAGLLLAGGAAYGVTAGLSGRTPHPVPAGLIAVKGCPRFYAVGGTVQKVTGATLVIQPSLGGPRVTVITSAQTSIRHTTASTVSAIADGTQVLVTGDGYGQPALAAHWIVIGLQLIRGSQPGPHQAPPQHGGGNVAAGTVTGVHSGGFTVLTPYGQRVRVTTSSSTGVSALTPASVGDLPAGGFLDAAGYLGPHGTLRAESIAQGSHLPIAVFPPGGRCPSPAATASPGSSTS